MRDARRNAERAHSLRKAPDGTAITMQSLERMLDGLGSMMEIAMDTNAVVKRHVAMAKQSQASGSGD